MTKYVQLKNDKVITGYASQQDPSDKPGYAELDDDDPRYLAFLNPPFDPVEAVKAVLPARETVLNRLTGIRLDAEDANDQELVAACKAARQGIKDLPNDPTVLATTDYDTFRTALLVAYAAIVQAAPVALQKAFREISL